MSIQVIGAGFGRTGTRSLQAALQILLGGKCFHYFEMSDNRPDLYPRWLEIARGKQPDWHAMMEGYVATVDWPSSHYYAELAAAFPDAKVILTVRDPRRWYKSVSETIFHYSMKGVRWPLSWMVQLDREQWAGLQLVHTLLWGPGGVFGGRFDDEEHAVAVYEAHIEEVKATIPPERLLIYRPGDGWEPLCDFLGLPVPAQPFPRSNSRNELLGFLRKMELLAWAVSPLTAPASLALRALDRSGTVSLAKLKTGR